MLSSSWLMHWSRRSIWILLFGLLSMGVGFGSKPAPSTAAALFTATDWRAIRALLPLRQQAYFKPSQVSADDAMGWSIAVSGDTIVVGAPHEDSSTAGVQNGTTPTVDEVASDAGAAYVFVRTGASWSQQAYLKASQVAAGDGFGTSVAVSGDIIVVGAPHEDSGTVGVQNGATPTIDEAASDAGAAYVFVRTGTSWSQQAYLKASQVSAGDDFGASVAVADTTVVVGAHQEDGSTTGVQNGATPTVDEATSDAGAAYVFVRDGRSWSQQAYLKASQVSAGDIFGASVAVADTTVVVGAHQEDSSTAGVFHSAAPTVDEAASDAGAVYVFVRDGTSWSQQAYLKASQVSAGDIFGFSVAVAGDTIVVGAPHEDSSTSGVSSSATPTVDEAMSDAGAAYVVVRNGTTWVQQTYLKAAQTSVSDIFGFSVAVAADTLVVGVPYEDSSTAGVDHSTLPTVDELASDAGAVYGFTNLPTLYLPFVTTSQPLVIAPLTPVAVPTTPVGTPGMIFLTKTITLPTPLSSSGHYWLSASPTALVPGLVDDAVILRVGSTEILRHHYGMTGELQAALVVVPVGDLLPWAGQTITVDFTDISGLVYSTTPLYLVWTP